MTHLMQWCSSVLLAQECKTPKASAPLTVDSICRTVACSIHSTALQTWWSTWLLKFAALLSNVAFLRQVRLQALWPYSCSCADNHSWNCLVDYTGPVPKLPGIIFVVGNAAWRDGASGGEVSAGSKLQNETSLSCLWAVVEAGHAPCRGIYCTLAENKNGPVFGAVLCNQVLCEIG